MKRKVLAVLLAASMMGTLGACGSSDSGKQTDAKTDDSSSTETTDSGEASADSSDGSFDGVKIEVDIEDSIQAPAAYLLHQSLPDLLQSVHLDVG